MGRWNIEELTARMDEGVIQRLDHYVYRLIDPRNGETFYVGVGKGKRVVAQQSGVFWMRTGPLTGMTRLI
jgi:hypothetical protein